MTFLDALGICTDATSQGHAATVGFDPVARAYYAVVHVDGTTRLFTTRSEWSDAAQHATAA